MYVEPNTTIKLLRNIPLDENQTDTLWFENLSGQLNYFNSRAVKTLTQNSYQRKSRNYCRLLCAIGDVFNVNYMMFQNSSFNNKWFFAFVTDIEYINNETVEIRYIIDPIQTWLFDYEIDETFVERETTESDFIGDHIEPENVNTGEYVMNGEYNDLTSLHDMSIVVAYVDPDADAIRGQLIDGVFSGADLYVYGTSAEEITELGNFLNSNIAHPDAIVNMYMCPTKVVGTTSQDRRITYGSSGYVERQQLAGVTNDTTVDGYLPKNKKLLTYPYNFVHVDAPNGQGLDDRYEFFNSGIPSYSFTANNSYPVELVCMPYNYKGSPAFDPSGIGSAVENRTERLTIKGFPICSWNFDAFKNWVSINGLPLALKTIASGVNTATGLYSRDNFRHVQRMRTDPDRRYTKTQNQYIQRSEVAEAGGSLADSAASILSEGYQASIQADITRGSFESGSNDMCLGRMTFKHCRMSVNKNYAERIDRFFTMFGYHVATVKKVETNLRSRFTYVKTVGASVHGNLPSDDAKYISDCFDSGIRFWKDVENINQYSEENIPNITERS